MYRCCLVVGMVWAGGARAQYGGNWNAFSSTSDNSSSRSLTSSSNASGATTNSPQTSTEAGVSTGVPAGPSSTIVAASAVLLVLAGGIVATVYFKQTHGQARLRAEEFRRLHPPQGATPPAPETPGAAPATPGSPPPQGGPQAQRPTLDAMVQARAWLLANRLQLRQDLALGAGPALEELASIAGIAPSRRAHFGRLLQRRRSTLSFATQLTPEEAADVMATLGELVFADPVLRCDGEAVLAER